MGYEAKTKRARRWVAAEVMQAKIDRAAAKLKAPKPWQLVARWPNDKPPERDAAIVALERRKRARSR